MPKNRNPRSVLALDSDCGRSTGLVRLEHQNVGTSCLHPCASFPRNGCGKSGVFPVVLAARLFSRARALARRQGTSLSLKRTRMFDWNQKLAWLVRLTAVSCVLASLGGARTGNGTGDTLSRQ